MNKIRVVVVVVARGSFAVAWISLHREFDRLSCIRHLAVNCREERRALSKLPVCILNARILPSVIQCAIYRYPLGVRARAYRVTYRKSRSIVIIERTCFASRSRRANYISAKSHRKITVRFAFCRLPPINDILVRSLVEKSMALIKTLFHSATPFPPISGPPLSSPSKGPESGKDGVGSVGDGQEYREHSTRRAGFLLDIYSFVRFYLFSRSSRGTTLFAPDHHDRTNPLQQPITVFLTNQRARL